ncbi:teichoic acid D-Ala incorporation-associated protein DltX [Staphylococcus pettenkoferi]|uniref:Teichoic acid D-Ala incorporation-associated protein DltX n=1 Tax=Staphylococcus pettenkoferi TaxID=170573 RepID=A0ABT4BJI2_9STAP|nr:teichoic acid D-Ala incorporation-associated protein DltX [Staphylococcus pettenkoferi]MCY1565388.1 teichoic acid D-Ala incorporation-associated protein DltX [Staphylococcus pettenkoferi]MCY1570997.1 teichoic acid D-Ala incorporation-associated protein DltX [Staphylococcus pettenkoferi]MCY1582830.1 teichoic acid D-Ala incorporation-associated protein DltX [Staphylococcus pettenkoferi]MCY1607296.1 teichoic acid D-Ala incorporation-associated protein DltX [Staphylococcus pettenkoferi]MDH96169
MSKIQNPYIKITLLTLFHLVIMVVLYLIYGTGQTENTFIYNEF